MVRPSFIKSLDIDGDDKITVKYGKLYHIVYDNPKAEEKIQLVHKMEEKHYNKFWYMLKKYHKNWWT